jgi:hypothetical protein
LRHSHGVSAPLGDNLLKRIGDDLDRNLYPVVYRGGRVEPDAASPSLSSGIGETTNEPGKDQAAPSGRRFERARAPQGSGRQAAASTTTPLLSELSQEDLVAIELEGVTAAYPQMKSRLTPSGFWVTGIINPIRGLSTSATLCVFIPSCRHHPIAGWAWWDTGVLIGPRHTNFGTASICAFEPRDGTWIPAHGFVRLLDLYVTWIVRHLHLQRLGRWPGNQVLHTAYERMNETQDDELCGCDGPERYRYGNCCRAADHSMAKWTVLGEYFSKNRSRVPVFPLEKPCTQCA